MNFPPPNNAGGGQDARPTNGIRNYTMNAEFRIVGRRSSPPINNSTMNTENNGGQDARPTNGNY
jgi:hypothetical protein